MGSILRLARSRLSAARARGFTLIEMLVSLAILMIIAVVVLTSHASFSNSLIVTNAAYDVALSLRQAESFGITSRGYGTAVNAGYGVHFFSSQPSSYILFVDDSPNSCGSGSTPDCKVGQGSYDSGSDGIVSTYTINAGITVSRFCVYRGSVSYCTGGGSHTFALDIVFKRPNTEAELSYFKDGTLYPDSATSLNTSACITLTAPAGGSRAVAVSSVGQVSTVASCP
jgi:prepilin-type N-terminal cleavage/methylation domain-containing protein